MTRDQQLKTLRSTKASKEQLRHALAASLGEPFEPNAQKKKEQSLFAQCQSLFMKLYKEQTSLDYSFVAKDGRALKSLIEKIGNMPNVSTNETIYLTFHALIKKLPNWYKENAFSLSVIDNKFNEIVASIKNNGGKQGITDDYRASVLNDLTT